MRDGPGNVLGGHLDVTELAVYAVLVASCQYGIWREADASRAYLRVDDQLLAVVRLWALLPLLDVDVLVHAGRAGTLQQACVLLDIDSDVLPAGVGRGIAVLRQWLLLLFGASVGRSR